MMMKFIKHNNDFVNSHIQMREFQVSSNTDSETLVSVFGVL